jgi:hypothetical protein
MKSFLDRFELRPQERRMVVVVALAFFVVLNIWFIWPFFGEWSVVQRKMAKSRTTLTQYRDEIGRKPRYETKLRELEATGEMLGSDLELQRIVTAAQGTSNLQILNSDSRQRSMGTRTNQFFAEQTLTVNYSSDGKELVDFLSTIAADKSLIRVRELEVRLDPSQTRLVGNLVLVGNYQRKATNTLAAPSRKRT